MDHLYDALRYGIMTRPRSSLWDYNPVSHRTGFQVADPNIWILNNMATENEQGELFETDEVSVMQETDDLDAQGVVAFVTSKDLKEQKMQDLQMKIGGYVHIETIVDYTIQTYSLLKLKSLVYLLK